MKNRFPNIHRGRLSAVERVRIVDLAERGLTAGQIALRMNRHPGTISYTMVRLGLRAPVARTFAYLRHGVEVRSFTREEDALVTALRVQDFSTPRIAEIVTRRFGHPRKAHTIGTRLAMLANREGA